MRNYLFLLAGSALFYSSYASADVSVTATVVSDYVFRGVSQTDSGPAAQLSLDYESDNGFYAGIWGSNVDFNDDANAEIDYIVGFSQALDDQFAYDISLTYYTYTGYSGDDEADYGEVIVNGYVHNFTVTFAYTHDYVQSGDLAQYIGLSYDYALPRDYNLALQAGYSFGDAFDDNEYVDYSATLTKALFGIDVSAALFNTNIDDDDTADFRFVIGASYSF